MCTCANRHTCWGCACGEPCSSQPSCLGLMSQKKTLAGIWADGWTQVRRGVPGSLSSCSSPALSSGPWWGGGSSTERESEGELAARDLGVCSDPDPSPLGQTTVQVARSQILLFCLRTYVPPPGAWSREGKVGRLRRYRVRGGEEGL